MSEWSVERAAPAALEELLAYPLKPEDREYVSQGARQLIEALLVEPGLTERGFHKSLDFLRRGFRTLSEITADSEADPGVADEKIERPLYMVGLPRSGTTFFHTLLSCDPAARSPRMWELEFPSPPPAAETFYDDPRIDQWIELQKGPNARSAVAISDPNVRRIHLAGPTATDECGPMLNSSGRALPMIAAARLSPYVNWWLADDKRPAFAIHRRWLQHLQRRNPGQYWVLKNPMSTFMVDAVVDAYPDLCLVQTHRDPCEVISSISSYIATTRRGNYVIEDNHALGMEMLQLWGIATDSFVAFRKSRPDVPVVDISYREMLARPMEMVRRVYAQWGRPLTDEAEAEMEAWLAANPQNRHGEHRHDLPSYGLTRERVERVMSRYFDGFGSYF